MLQVTVMHSMQAGYMEKAQKYTDKAFMQIEKLRSTYSVLCRVCLLLVLYYNHSRTVIALLYYKGDCVNINCIPSACVKLMS